MQYICLEIITKAYHPKWYFGLKNKKKKKKKVMGDIVGDGEPWEGKW